MDARARVAHNVRRLRVIAGLSQEALAVDAAIDRTYVSRLERGLENPTVGVLERVAKAVNADIVDIVTEVIGGRRRLPTLLPGRKAVTKRR